MISKKIRYLVRGLKYMNKRGGYSESGEDSIAAYLMQNKIGTYVDVGAGHPVVGSNTYAFYRRGWNGVAIDPNPSLKFSWSLLRPRDSFLECSIGADEGLVEFYEYDNDLRSTTNASVKEFYSSKNRIHKTSKVRQKSLNEIFSEKVQGGMPVFLSIDVEGSEYEVLNSLNFKEFSPTLIGIESWSLPWRTNDETQKLLKNEEYVLVAYSGLTAFYAHEDAVINLIQSRPNIN